MKNILYLITILIFLASCDSNVVNNYKLEDESIFPKVLNISDSTNTDFVPTLESSFSNEKNNIYGATIPLAWNEIKNEIGGTLSEFSSNQLKEINNTNSYKNSLKKGEYTTSIEVEGTEIRAKAYFRKSLPFEEPLRKFDQSFDDQLEFNNVEVESFGFHGYRSFAQINYYLNKDEYSISLFPENKEHEIILIMKKAHSTNFTDYLRTYNKEKKVELNNTIYFNDDDKVQIPIIEFNLEKSFDQIIGSSFKAKNRKYEMLEAYQRNAFILNENGAEVESEAEFAADAVEAMEKPLPKLMIFNKPFVIFLKRKDSEYPYFGVYLANQDLMKLK